MAGHICLTAAQLSLNLLGGGLTFVAQATAPTYAPGMAWVNTTPNPDVLYVWVPSLSAWVNAQSRYLTLLTADPATSGPGGGAAVNVADLVEVTTPGFARTAVSIGLASNSMPCVVTSTGLCTFGPLTATMTVPAKWVALVSCASGSSGILIYTWDGISEQVDASQMVQVPVGGLILSQS